MIKLEKVFHGENVSMLHLKMSRLLKMNLVFFQTAPLYAMYTTETATTTAT